MPQYYGNILCLEHRELVPGVMKLSTYEKLNTRGKLNVVRRGGGVGVSALIAYESIGRPYKDAIDTTYEQYGGIYKYMAKTPLLARVVYDIEAEKFYSDYTYSNGTCKLQAKHIQKYATAASWLNLLAQLTADKTIVKKELKLTMQEFWETLSSLIEKENIDLPKHRIRLQEKIELYKAKGYECLISAEFGNDKRRKVKDELADALLSTMLEHANKHDDTIIQLNYNKWAAENGRPLIKAAATIGNYRRDNDWRLRQGREGNNNNYNQYGLSIGRNRPSAPLLLINSDDNDLDLFFIEEVVKTDKQGNARITTNPYKRFTLVVIIDAYNDYILGYAIGNAQTHALVEVAYMDAMYHIQQLTGGWYLPHQIQTDHWGIDRKLSNSLSQFYKSLGTYTPAAVRNSRSKYIERSFGQEWHQELKQTPYNNYAGYNITAKERLNPDAVQLHKKEFPNTTEAPAIIAAFIERMRTNNNRQQQWLDAFRASEKSREKCISDEQMLMRFGQPHVKQNTITNKELQLTIDKADYEYSIPEELYLQNVGKRVQVYYDEYDMSRVLVSDGKRLRFIAEAKGRMPSALADYQPGDGARLHALQARKANDMMRIAEERDKRRKLLKSQGVNAEKMLQWEGEFTKQPLLGAGVSTKNMQLEGGVSTKNMQSEGGVNAASILQAGVLDKSTKQEAQQKWIEQNASKSDTGKGFDIYSQM